MIINKTMRFGKQFWTESLGKKWALNLKETLKSSYAEKLMGFVETEYSKHLNFALGNLFELLS